MLGNRDKRDPVPTCMSDVQKGQQSQDFHQSPPSSSSPMEYAPSSPSRLRECQTHDYNTSLPQRQFTAEYLRGLRKNRVERPTGSRPPPPSRFDSGNKRSTTNTTTPATQQPAKDERPSLQTSTSMPLMKQTRPAHQHHASTSAIRSPFAGRPLIPPPSSQNDARAKSPSPAEEPQQTVRRAPSMTYTERGSRWMEKQEAHSIRQAMEDMALKEERRLHEAARDEAAELVWRHQNPDNKAAQQDSAYSNPDLKKDYRSHLRKGSYRRSVSQETSAILVAHQRSVSGNSSSSSSEEQHHSQDMASSHDDDDDDDDDDDKGTTSKPAMAPANRKISPPAAMVSVPKTRTASGPSYAGLAEAVASDIARAHRRSSSGSNSNNGRRILSGEKKFFMHPDDRIWEDPQEEATPKKEKRERIVIMEEPTHPSPPAAVPPLPAPEAPFQPTYVRKNPFARVRMQAEKLDRSQSDSSVPSTTTTPSQRPNRVEIHRNPPSQSRNPFYVSNVTLPPIPPPASESPADEVAPKDAGSQSPGSSPSRDGKEIRSDDIRAATRKSRADYSPKLPRPTMVSDKPGRPIVSFQQDWRPREVVLEEASSPALRKEYGPAKGTRGSNSSPSAGRNAYTNAPSISVGSSVKPPIPQICLPDEAGQPQIPTINLPDDDQPAIPSIAIQEDADISRPTNRSAPSIPTINVSGTPSINIQGPSHEPSNSRALPHRAAISPTSPSSSPPKSSPHYTPSYQQQQSGTLCAHCALPIAGRILSASDNRFHPACFNCHECGTNLELVAFYPEPETKCSERLNPDSTQPSSAAAAQADFSDQDPAPRFYCHLDYHELFSPRCKSCKTPIEGEVILACGAEWHAGHFFCAQCGDPFTAEMPFVEKDGYAWCVGCHTNRYSAKCRRCRKPVVETVVKALGAEWHGECFVCWECNSEFTDGKFFLRGGEENPVCVACEERRLKA